MFYWFGPHEYWATHWARDYTDGFARRGLLGEIIALLGGDNTNYALITFGSWIAALGLAAVLIDAMWRLTRRMGQWEATILTMAVLISPATSGILLETLGDPLQLILHGDQDDVVNYSFAQAIQAEAASKGIPYAFYTVSGARHSFREVPINSLTIDGKTLLQITYDFIDAHLQAGTPVYETRTVPLNN